MRSDEPCSFPAFEGGSILIVTVWVLFLLGILAAAVGVQAARRLEASERLRGRVQAYAAARAGVATAVAVLALDTNGWDALSERWADSPADFCAISCGNGRFSVVRAGDGGADGTATNYGASDESARIDLNQAGVDVIRGLLIVAGGLTPQAADELSKAIDASRKTSGRDGSKTPILTPFFCVQDLLAVPGVDDTQFRRLEPYLTVHSGTKQININTAGPIVLESVLRRAEASISGHSDTVTTLVRKILQFRKGGGIFTTRTLDGLAGAVSSSFKLEGDERALLNALGWVVSVRSDKYRIVSEGECLMGRRFQRRIECVWNRAARRFESWNED